MSGTKRQLNIELLRIFSMLLITLFHLKQHFMDNLSLEPSLCKTFMDYVIMFIPFHVDLFILITGYFGIRHCKQPLIKTVLLLYFYSISINLCSWFITGDYSIVDALMPISQRKWWFMTMYVVMLMIAPIIEYYAKDCNRKKINLMALGALFVNLYLSHFTHVRHIYDGGFGIVNFVSIYVLGLWLRNVGIHLFANVRHPRIMLLSAILLSMAIQYKSMPYFSGMALAEYCGPYSTLMAVFIFLFFLKIRVPEFWRGIVMFFSSSAIAVYMITDHPTIYQMLRPLFNACYLPEYKSVMDIVMIMLCVIIAYISACLIDKIRIPIVEFLSKKILSIPFFDRL